MPRNTAEVKSLGLGTCYALQIQWKQRKIQSRRSPGLIQPIDMTFTLKALPAVALLLLEGAASSFNFDA